MVVRKVMKDAFHFGNYFKTFLAFFSSCEVFEVGPTGNRLDSTMAFQIDQTIESPKA